MRALLLHADNSPVVCGLSWNGLVSFNPVNNQLAHFRARAISDWRVFVHGEAPAAIHPIVVGDYFQFLRHRQRLISEFEIDDALSNRLGEIDVVTHALSHVKVVAGNSWVN